MSLEAERGRDQGRWPAATEGRRATEWNDLAALDPLWAILGEPTRKPGFDLTTFLASGETELASILGVAASLGSTHGFERALDVGCGLGRIVRAMSTRFEQCVGIDISERMIAQARQLHADHSNCEFRVEAGPRLDLEARSFDLVYSRLVLQHLARRTEVTACIDEFFRLVRPGGLVVFQVPVHLPWRARIQPRRRLWTGLRAAGVPPTTLFLKLHLHPLRLLAVPEVEIQATIARAGGVVLLAAPDEKAAPPAHSISYFAELDRPESASAALLASSAST